MKRIFVIPLCFVLVVALCRNPSSAYDVVLLPDADSFFYDGYSVLPLASVDNYTVDVYVTGNWTSSNTISVATNSTLNANQNVVYYSSNINGFGIRVTIPPNNQSGTLYCYGLFPSIRVRTETSAKWVTETISSAAPVAYPDYIVSSQSQIGFQSDSFQNVAPFNGSVSIPSHSNVLYLYLFSRVPSPSTSLSTGYGGFRSTNSFISFVPDSIPVDYSPLLSTVVTNTSDSASRLSTIVTNTSNTASRISTTNSYLSTTNSYLSTNNNYLSSANTSLTNSLNRLVSIDNQLSQLQISLGELSPMEEFEQDYLDKMDGQLTQIEDMMSPQNTALPNGGDIAGFASDIQDGLGVSGSSFDAAEFSEAVSAFSGSGAITAGGPWEFFTQDVADSLSGDAQAVGLNDDDYVYAWLEMMQRRYSLWDSSSP